MPSPLQHLSPLDRNTEIPFFPSETWVLTNADLGNLQLYTFNWIQAFWDITSFAGGIPKLVVTCGYPDANGNPICSVVPFAFSGERVNIKGKAILSSGKDIRGVTQTSTPLGAVVATDILYVVAYGGMQ